MTSGLIASINRSTTATERLIASMIVFIIGKGGLTVRVCPFVILGRDIVTGASRRLGTVEFSARCPLPPGGFPVT
jgi:hypothetical protein